MIVLSFEEIDVWFTCLVSHAKSGCPVNNHRVALHEIEHRVLANRHQFILLLDQLVEVNERVSHHLEFVTFIHH